MVVWVIAGIEGDETFMESFFTGLFERGEVEGWDVAGESFTEVFAVIFVILDVVVSGEVSWLGFSFTSGVEVVHGVGVAVVV